MSGFAFHQAERERAMLIDHIGACERILKTPLPAVYSIKIRRFLVLFLVTLTFALFHKFQSDWLVPPFLMLVAYPMLAVDQIGASSRTRSRPGIWGICPSTTSARRSRGISWGCSKKTGSIRKGGAGRSRDRFDSPIHA